jgi:hypothetical protein
MHTLDAIRMILTLTGVQIILSCAESLYDSRIYRQTGILCWTFVQLNNRLFFRHAMVRRIFYFLFSYPNVLFLITARLLLTAYMLNLLYHGVSPDEIRGLILLICVTGILFDWRNTYSNNGADQLSNIILIAVSLSTLEGDGKPIKIFSIIFIACQAELSYLTSGFLKLLEKDWRNGHYLKGIFDTGNFGNRRFNEVLSKHPVFYKVISNVVIYGELCLGFAFLFPPYICLPLLAFGLIFHLSTAIIMGLNTFFWVFSATYPAIWFISVHI